MICFNSVFGVFLGKSPYSVWIQETADQKNSEYGYFSCNDLFHNSETVFLLQKSWSQNFYFHFAMRPGKKLKVDLTLSWWRSLSNRKQFTDLLCKSMHWFLYDKEGLRYLWHFCGIMKMVLNYFFSKK